MSQALSDLLTRQVARFTDRQADWNAFADARGAIPSSRPGSVLVGASIKRKEDARLVAGRGRYLDDIALPEMLHLGLVRSPHAHARILEIHRDGARGGDGVVAVWTIEDLPELAVASVPPLVPEPRGRPYRHPVLAANRVRHAGEAIAVV